MPRSNNSALESVTNQGRSKIKIKSNFDDNKKKGGGGGKKCIAKSKKDKKEDEQKQGEQEIENR